MNPFSLLRIEIIKRPMFNLLLVLLVAFGGNLWWAVIILTLIIRLLLVKNAVAATKMQGDMQNIQPQMQDIQEKYKDDPQRMSQEMMNIFKKSWGGPLKWCMSMLIQIPVFLWLFYSVRDISTYLNGEGTLNVTSYSFLEFLNVDFSTLETSFYGLDLLASQNLFLAVIAGLLMFAQMKFTSLVKPSKAPKLPGVTDKAGMPDMQKMMGNMQYFFVIMMAVFVFSVPAAVWLYILTTTLFGVLQMAYQYRSFIGAKIRTLRGKPEIIEG